MLPLTLELLKGESPALLIVGLEVEGHLGGLCWQSSTNSSDDIDKT